MRSYQFYGHANWILILAISLICFSQILGQDKVIADDTLSLFQWIQKNDVDQITIITDFNRLKKKMKDREYQEGLLLLPKGTENDTLNIRVRPRGNQRQVVCSFPPLKIKIDPDELEERGLSDIKSYKLVTHCKSAKSFRSVVYRELLAYKLYNVVTDTCLQAETLTINYIDPENGKVQEDQWGFILESKKDFAARTGGRIIDRKRSHPVQNEDYQTVFMSMFQYMIANTDWTFYNLHNLFLVKYEQFPKTVPIAYDFDYSGLVDAKYAVPFEKFDIKKVTDRLYLDICRDRPIIQSVINHFLSKEEEIITVCQEFEDLDESNKKEVIRFMNKFFKTLKNKKELDRVFRSTCD